MQRLIATLGILALACLGQACGSTGDEATSALLTKAQFVQRADAICERFQKERQAEAAKWLRQQPGGPAQAESHYDEGFKVIVAPSMRIEAEELAELSPPKKNAAELARMVENFKQGSKAVAAQGRRGLLVRELKDFEREAETLKMPGCANPL
jgi:hypothetical protein